MSNFFARGRRFHSTFRVLAMATIVGSTFAWVGMIRADLDPKAITITLPDQIKWKEGESGSATAVMEGDPAKPGHYMVLTKWHAGHMSRPHFHQNDRYIMVLKGTWWVGTGTKYDPPSTKPVPEGSFVVHTGKQVHYDGAKAGGGDCILLIQGEGPATSTPAEVK
jgi:hypothetical protein